MISEKSFAIERHDFTPNLFDASFYNNPFTKDLWPIVYILSDGKEKEAYVGETTDAFARLSTHLKNSQKQKLTTVHLISSEKFNKSATLDIESNLIKYVSGDGQYTLLNGNLGLANHSYFQKREVYWEIFKSIWDSLRAEGITRHSIEHIDNSDLFKYSPYKSLSKDQRSGLLAVINSLLNRDFKHIIVEGGAGTGKTILAVFLFKLLNTDNEDFNFREFAEDEAEFVQKIKDLKAQYTNPKMALVVPMASFRSTLKQVFKNIKGLNVSMVIGPAEVTKTKYDLLVVDESHRLRRRVNLGAYYGAFDKACNNLGLDKNSCTELDWVVMQAENTVLFYDESQSIKPSDATKEDFDKLKALGTTKIEKLKSQFRVRGGNAYVEYVGNLLNCSLRPDQKFEGSEYEFLLFDSLDEMIERIKKKEREHGLARLIAGFSWKWISNNDKEAYDIQIGDVQLRWNGTSSDWINSENSVNEVGCIHTTQGYDLNYAGIIFGNEISYDKANHKIIIKKENYFDRNGKQSIEDPEVLKSFIINIYKTIMLRGIKGTFVYACDPDLQDYLSRFIPTIGKRRKEEISFVPHDKVIPFENSIPLYDLKVAAGSFGEVQRVEDVDWISLPNRYRPSKDLFACTVVGESMNKVIPNGSVCLFRKYTGGSRNGKIVLVEHSDIHDSDFGSCYTVKEYWSKKGEKDSHWEHESIVLKPLSYDDSYEGLVLENYEGASFKVLGLFEGVLG